MIFICDNCTKLFSVKGDAAIKLMLSVTERVCSPECAAELLLKKP